MDIGSLLVVLAIALITVAYIARPIIQHQGRRVTLEDRRLSALAAERDRVLSMLQELEMDMATGKIESEHYQAQRAALVAEGAAILKEMDALRGAPAGAAAAPLQDPETEIEAAVARLRKGQSGGEAPAGFCPQCGKPAAAGDRFCIHCGNPLQSGAEERA